MMISPAVELAAVARRLVATPRWLMLLAAAGLLSSTLLSREAAADEQVSFDREVRPILSDACFRCHGPDAHTREADLRLDLPPDAAAGHPAIVPGDPAASLLYQRIVAEDESELMPPADSGKELSAEQKEILRRWIEQGAPYQGHWAFEPIAAAALTAPTDTASSQALPTHPVDRLLEARLQQVGLAAGGRASREVLIRRVSFALTGLPPTLAELDQYLGDTRPGAYERMVDRYLASPRFGEEMARHWLDVARYADTHGLHLDNERQMWAYRDWVVDAFNQNLPFDQFTIQQIAGDLLPEPTPQQLVATGFNRCNVTTSEGGALAEEFQYRYAVERTSVVAEVWLGLTAGCAACHDHKYDPLSTREFYSLYAFFNSAADPAMDGNIDTTAPFLKLPSEAERAAGESATKVEQEALAWLRALAEHTRYRDPSESETTAAAPSAVREQLFDEVFPLGVTSKSSTRNAVRWELDPQFGAASGRRVIRQASAAKITDTIEFKLRPLTAPADGAIEISLRVDPVQVPETVTLGIPGKGTAVWNRTPAGFVRHGQEGVVFQPGQWARLSVPTNALRLEPGERINAIQITQTGGVAYWDNAVLVGTADPASDPLESLARWRQVIGTTVPADLPAEHHAAVRGGPDGQLDAAALESLRRDYVALIARPLTPELAAARTVWQAARQARVIAEEASPGTMIYRDAPEPRQSFVMLRGQYDAPGDPVEPAVPAFLPPLELSGDARPSRLDLARWLVAAENPLTARVTVNRLWQQLFGTGLVKTANDFGLQGDPPSHPELLDHLAAHFRDTGWNVKAFVRLLVTSAAFQRDSRLTPEMLQLDPENRLYARGPRLRLDAEQLRDNVLAVSGLIDLQMGGRGVNPYQPPNIWEPVGYSDSNTRFYQQDYGSALYRRSLYVFLKRTAPPPFMSNFDAPNREQACTSRDRSNTPLQALQLMNDVQHFEAARVLAERALLEAGKSDQQRIEFLYRTVLARQPDEEQLRLVSQSLEAQRAIFAEDPAAAAAAIQVGQSPPQPLGPPEQLAAWTMVANLILNLDETINRN